MREDRLVLPIPPGMHWRDAMPVLMPTEDRALLEAKKRKAAGAKPLRRERTRALGKLWFESAAKPAEKAERAKKPRVTFDPQHLAKARELRDRYLEQFNSGVLADGTKILPAGKYQVSKQIDAKRETAPLMLENAA